MGKSYTQISTQTSNKKLGMLLAAIGVLVLGIWVNNGLTTDPSIATVEAEKVMVPKN